MVRKKRSELWAYICDGQQIVESQSFAALCIYFQLALGLNRIFLLLLASIVNIPI